MLTPPARVGMHLDEIDTPALIVEMDVFERNLRRMADAAGAAGIRLRPHSKTHKSTSIANMQIALGAVGVCCQKVAEAEIMVDGGVRDVLVANEIVGPVKTARLAALARRAKISTCVDRIESVHELEKAAAGAGSTLHVLVELNVGGNRCGVENTQDVVAVAAAIEASPHLSFAGLQAYQGAAQHLREYESRRDAIAGAAAKAKAAKDALAEAGINCPAVTGAGTGTFEFEIASGIYTELQVGSYIFMDRDYAANLPGRANSFGFEHSLFILAGIMSRPLPERLVVDAGSKSYSVDGGGFPAVFEQPELQISRVSDEHGVIVLPDPAASFDIGQKLKLVPGHCDPTVNLHDWFICVRNDRVEALWPVSARGALT